MLSLLSLGHLSCLPRYWHSSVYMVPRQHWKGVMSAPYLRTPGAQVIALDPRVYMNTRYFSLHWKSRVYMNTRYFSLHWKLRARKLKSIPFSCRPPNKTLRFNIQYVPANKIEFPLVLSPAVLNSSFLLGKPIGVS
jgi:hypothetical protein